MGEATSVAITIRLAVSEDAGGIARTFLESAEYHASILNAIRSPRSRRYRHAIGKGGSIRRTLGVSEIRLR